MRRLLSIYSKCRMLQVENVETDSNFLEIKRRFFNRNSACHVGEYHIGQ